jgi:hypothetical protein
MRFTLETDCRAPNTLPNKIHIGHIRYAVDLVNTTYANGVKQVHVIKIAINDLFNPQRTPYYIASHHYCEHIIEYEYSMIG